MKVINGIKYYNSRETAMLVKRSQLTVVNWDKQSDILEKQGKERLIPKPIRVGGNNSRFWSKEDIEKMKEFRDSVRVEGTMTEFNKRYEIEGK